MFFNVQDHGKLPNMLGTPKKDPGLYGNKATLESSI